MKDRKYLYPFLLVLILLGLAGIYIKASSSSGVSNQLKIGVTYMTMNNDFYKTINAEIKKQVGQHQDILYVRDPELSEDKQSQQINYFVSQDVDVIVINPVKRNSEKIISALKLAKAKGIKIIAVDTQIEGDIDVDTTIVSDNYQAGVLTAQDMMAHLKEADILLLEHSDTISASQRIQGFLDTIQSHPQYRVVARKDTLGQTEVGLPEVRDVIESGIDFNVVMALNDRSALGALAAVKEAALQQSVYIYGVDGSPDMKNLLYHTEDVQATVAQSPITMGKKTAELIYLLTDNRPVEDTYIMPVTLINKTNIEQFDITGWQ